MKKRLICLSLVILFFISLVNFVDAYLIKVIPLDGSGRLTPSTTYNYTFNLTTDISCNNVLLTNSTIVTTDIYGRAFININTSLLNDSITNYICEYRDGNLRAIHMVSDQTFRNVYSNKIITKDIITGNLSDGTNYLTVAQAKGAYDYSLLNNTNKSNYWDDVNDYNTTQMFNNGGTLNILTTWLTTFINNLLTTQVHNNATIVKNNTDFYAQNLTFTDYELCIPIAGACDLTINHSKCCNNTGTYIVG